MEKKNILDAVTKSVSDLHREIDMHHKLMASLVGHDVEPEKINEWLAQCRTNSNECRLKDAIMEAIDVLEESRKAFKSRRLEMLRKKLTQVLIEVD